MRYLYLFFRASTASILMTVLCLVLIILLILGCKNEFELTSTQQPYHSIRDLKVDPQNDDIIYAVAGGGLYKSTVGGGSWKHILGDNDDDINAIAINHSYPDTIYAIGSSLFKSGNGGDSWQSINIPFRGDLLELDPLDSQILYAGGDSRLYKSIDGGNSWTIGMFHQITDICIDHTEQGIVYVVRDEGLYKSMDRGTTWTRAETGMTGSVWVVEMGPQNSETLYCGTISGLFKSTDGAENWVGTQLESSIISIAVHAQNSNTIYASTLDKLFKSSNGGINWKEVAIVPPLTHPRFEISSVRIDPFNSDIIFVLITGEGYYEVGDILKSENAGKTWEQKSSGLPRVPRPDWHL